MCKNLMYFTTESLFLNITSLKYLNKFFKEDKYLKVLEYIRNVLSYTHDKENIKILNDFINKFKNNYKNGLLQSDLMYLFYDIRYSFNYSCVVMFINEYMNFIYIDEDKIVRRAITEDDLNKDYIVVALKRNMIVYHEEYNDLYKTYQDVKIIVYNESKVNISEWNDIPIFSKGRIFFPNYNLRLENSWLEIIEDKSTV